jgi:hypothetical protein
LGTPRRRLLALLGEDSSPFIAADDGVRNHAPVYESVTSAFAKLLRLKDYVKENLHRLNDHREQHVDPDSCRGAAEHEGS